MVAKVFFNLNTVIVLVTLLETRLNHELSVLIKVMFSNTILPWINFLLIPEIPLCDVRITCQIQARIPVENAV